MYTCNELFLQLSVLNLYLPKIQLVVSNSSAHSIPGHVVVMFVINAQVGSNHNTARMAHLGTQAITKMSVRGGRLWEDNAMVTELYP